MVDQLKHMLRFTYLNKYGLRLMRKLNIPPFGLTDRQIRLNRKRTTPRRGPLRLPLAFQGSLLGLRTFTRFNDFHPLLFLIRILRGVTLIFAYFLPIRTRDPCTLLHLLFTRAERR